jgi:hypothetical protein
MGSMSRKKERVETETTEPGEGTEERGERRVEEERPTREERERGALGGWLGPSLKINLKQDKR